MVEAGTVRRLLETIEQRLARVQREAETPLEVYLEDPDLQDIVERNLEICIQACIDLGLHLLADRPRALPETNRGVFQALQGEGLIGAPLATRLERMAGFRNVLAHAYTEVIAAEVHATLGNLEDIKAYVRELSEHLGDDAGGAG